MSAAAPRSDPESDPEEPVPPEAPSEAPSEASAAPESAEPAEPALPPRPLIEASGLTLRRGRRAVLDGVDLVVRPGASLGLLGPTGAGKTALLRALLGIEPARGAASVLGLDPRREGPRIRAAVGYVPHQLGYPDGATAIGLERLTRAFHGRWPTRRCFKLLDQLQVPARTPVERLSPALRARLALALAVTPEPRLLIVDPPEELDAAGRRDLWTAVARERGAATLVAASGEPREVESLVDSVCVLHAGRVVAAGSRAALAGEAGLEAAYLALVGE